MGNRIGADIKEYGGIVPVFVGYYLLVHALRSTFCPMLALTGIPCAGCGLTRAALYLLGGQPARAAYINPSIFVVLLFLLYCGYFRYIRGGTIRGFRWAFAALIFLVLAIYAVRMYCYFPYRSPYVYQKDNLLSNRIPWYGDWIQKGIQWLRGLRR